MKKQIGLLLAGAMMVALPSVVKAADVEALVNFNEGNPTGRLYFPVAQDMRLIAGLSLKQPVNQTDKEFGYSVLGGVELGLPFVGRSEITTTLTKGTGHNDETVVGAFKLTKNAVYNITKDVKIGLSVDLVSISLDRKNTDMKYVNIISSIYPVLGATINF